MLDYSHPALPQEFTQLCSGFPGSCRAYASAPPGQRSPVSMTEGMRDHC
jgi:hypothetical protein